MLGHALMESCAMRAILRYPLRSSSLNLLTKCSPALLHASSPLSCQRRRYNTGNPEWNWVDRTMGAGYVKNAKAGGKGENPIDYTDGSNVVPALEKEIHKWIGNRSLARKISQWGLRGDTMRGILTSHDPEHPQKGGSPDTTMTALIQLWSQEALESLQSRSSSFSATIDLDNARHAMVAEGQSCLKRLLMNSFLRWLEAQLKTQPDGARLVTRAQNLHSLVDMRFPSQKYDTARSIIRQIHLHVGPTNSGKTHGALVALCKAETGLYAGPLRLLAHEVWERIRSGTVSPGLPARPCNLITGEEVKTDDALAGLSSCTVEMLNFNTIIDVAVVDEIQMIGDHQRGSAWTTAVLALPAKELHLCGESSVIPLIAKMAEACGDVLHIHNYKRLTPLKIGPSLGGDLKSIRKGDCIVAFSRTEIFWLKQQIETLTPFKCALAYGALPPETKSEQARKFNDPDNDVSVMVASDAIGMGLNLKIKRVIFSKVTKWNGTDVVPISTSQLKQIAGRAGRYGTSKEDAAGGLATTLHYEDLGVLEAALEVPLVPITRAGIHPSSETLTALATMLPSKKKQEYMQKGRNRNLMTLYSDLSLLTSIDSRIYFSGSYEQQLKVGPLLEEYVSDFTNMTIADRELFAIAPANFRDERMVALLSNIVNYYARGGLIKFEDVDCLDLLKTMESVETVAEAFNHHNKGKNLQERAANLGIFLRRNRQKFNIDDLMTLESLHRGLTLYLWLSYRRPVNFCYRAEVENYSRRAEKAIDFCLEAVKAARALRMEYEENSKNKGASNWQDYKKDPFKRRGNYAKGKSNDMHANSILDNIFGRTTFQSNL